MINLELEDTGFIAVKFKDAAGATVEKVIDAFAIFNRLLAATEGAKDAGEFNGRLQDQLKADGLGDFSQAGAVLVFDKIGEAVEAVKKNGR